MTRARHIFLCESILPWSKLLKQSPFNSKPFQTSSWQGQFILSKKESFKRDVTQESEISLHLAFTTACEEGNLEFPLHCDGNWGFNSNQLPEKHQGCGPRSLFLVAPLLPIKWDCLCDGDHPWPHVSQVLRLLPGASTLDGAQAMEENRGCSNQEPHPHSQIATQHTQTHVWLRAALCTTFRGQNNPNRCS